VTNARVREAITERIKNAGKLYLLVRDKLWKWNIPKTGKMCLYKTYYEVILENGSDIRTGQRQTLCHFYVIQKDKSGDEE
jgi:hypothetical protein